MSFPSKEKGREGSTSVELDEDSGHDSVDSLHTAADERERIAHLETAVSWIRQEVALLQAYDKDILQELWKIRSGVHEIREGHRQQIQLERRFLHSTSPTSPDDSTSERSYSPTSLNRLSATIDPQSPTSLNRMSATIDPQSPTGLHRLSAMIDPHSPTSLNKFSDVIAPRSPASLHRNSDAIDPHSLSPSPDNLPRQHPQLGRTASGTMDRYRAPAHLQQQNDDQVLAQFFGTEQVSKLNEFKKSLAPVTDESSAAETGKNKPLPKRPSSGSRSQPSPKSNRSSSKSPKSNHSSPKSNPASTDRMGPRPNRADSGKGKTNSPSQQHKQPPQGIANGTAEGHEVSDVVSEMQKLRLRLQQTALQELAEIDRQFSPKLQRTSSGQAGHLRQSSLDCNPLSGHTHQGSPDSTPKIGHVRYFSSDFTAQAGNARHGSSVFTAQTGHGSADFTADTSAHKGSSDPTFKQLQSGHRRQGSADHIFLHQDHHYSRQHSENSVPSISINHPRQSSLPVDPSSLVINVRRSTSPSILSPPPGLHYESRSLERTRSPSGSRSPTPPYQDYRSHGHVRQGSLGSVSPPPFGSGSLSPPPGYSYQPQHQLQQSQGSDVFARRTVTPPRDNGNGTQQPISHRNYRQPPQSTTGGKKSPQPASGGKPPPSTSGGKPPPSTSGGKPPPSTSGGKPPPSTSGGKPPPSTSGAKPVPPSKPPRNMSGSHTTGHPKKSSGANQDGSSMRSGSLPKWRPGSAGSGPHYSTAVIKRGKKHAEASAGDDQPSQGGGGTSTSPAVVTESTYDRLGPPGIYGYELDQPEHKSLLSSTTVPRSASPGATYRKVNPRPSPTVPPKNKAKGETLPNASRGDRHPKLELQPSAPLSGDAPALIDRSAPVYPEEIKPYMTSGELKDQMQSFKYTPFTEKGVKKQNSGSDLRSNGKKHEKSTKAVLPTEQTWC